MITEQSTYIDDENKKAKQHGVQWVHVVRKGHKLLLILLICFYYQSASYITCTHCRCGK